MNTQQIESVRVSFALVQPIAGQAAETFYDNLFEADPQLRALFKGNMAHQGERLMAMIGSALGLLDRPASLLPVLRSLGARHVAYGVQDAHYATVGAALIKTLGQGLGDACTSEVRNAWIDLYSVISATMIEGAREPVAA
ncbi:globin family protein [soil metagenome]